MLSWSTLAPFTKLLLNEAPNFQVIFVCSIFAAAFLLAVNIVSGNIKNIRKYRFKDIAAMAGLGFIGLFLYLALYNLGLANLTSQQACVINYLWPIMTVVFSCIIMRERLTLMKAVAMLCSFIGIVILSLGVNAAAGGNAVIGMIGCAVAAALYGLYSVLNNKTGYDLKISMMVAWFTAAVLALPVGLIFEVWTPIAPAQWLGYIWLGVIGDGLAYLVWAMALMSAGRNTASVANLAYLTPFLSLTVSTVFLREDFDEKAVIALAFIVGGILVQSILEARRTHR